MFAEPWLLAVSMLVSSSNAADRSACDALGGADALSCIAAQYPKIYTTVEAACKGAAEGVRACRVTQYGDRGIVFNSPKAASASAAPRPASTSSSGMRTIKIDPNAAQVASIALLVAGTTLTLVPSVCANDPKCTLTLDDQRVLSTFGSIVATQGSQVSTVLASGVTDAEKVDQLIVLTQTIFERAPTGLAPQAQGYVDAAVVASRSIVASALR